MAYVEKIIGQDEKLVGVARLHWIYLVQGIFVFCCFAGLAWLVDTVVLQALSYLSLQYETLATTLYKISGYAVWAIVAIGVFYMAAEFTRVLVTEIALTTRRVLYKTGWIFVNVRHIDLEEIRGESLDLGVFGRFLGYGYLILDARFIGDERLPAIAKAEAFIKALHHHRANTQDALSVVVGKGNPAPVAISAPDPDNDRNIQVTEGADVQKHREKHKAAHYTPEAPEDMSPQHAAAVEGSEPRVQTQPAPKPQAAAPQPGVQQPPTVQIVTVDPQAVAQAIQQVMPQVAEQVAKEMVEQGVLPASPKAEPAAEEDLIEAFDDAKEKEGKRPYKDTRSAA